MAFLVKFVSFTKISYNPGTNVFRIFFMFYQTFLLPRVKANVIISNNKSRRLIFGSLWISRKSPNCTELWTCPQSSIQNENFVSNSKSSWTFPTVHYFTRNLMFIPRVLSLVVFENNILLIISRSPVQIWI